jgi:hypothetical protein
MTKMVVQGTVHVTRDGKRVVPTIGEVFDFTDEEMVSVRKHGLGRRAVNELSDDGETETVEQAVTAAKKPAKPAKTATVDDSDL